MKQYSLIFSFVLFSTLSFSQNFAETFLKVDFTNYERPSAELLRNYFRYEVYPVHTPAHPASRSSLSQAKLMSDLIKEYPSSWVSNYISTEISVQSNGKIKKAAGVDGTLSTEQRALLEIADVNTKVTIKVQYKQENSATRKIEINNLNYLIVVIPDIQAEYPGGTTALKQYLKTNVVDRISDADLKGLREGSVEFTIDEKGQVEALQQKETTGNPTVDQLLLKVIQEMPQWSPAKNAKGVSVKQRLEFAAGGIFGGC